MLGVEKCGAHSNGKLVHAPNPQVMGLAMGKTGHKKIRQPKGRMLKGIDPSLESLFLLPKKYPRRQRDGITTRLATDMTKKSGNQIKDIRYEAASSISSMANSRVPCFRSLPEVIIIIIGLEPDAESSSNKVSDHFPFCP